MKPVIIIYAMVLAGVYTGYSPQQVMVDVTNDFGICVLQLVSSRRENVAFSPYGIVSVGLVLYEGANGPTAAEIHNTLRLPWDRHVTRIGFRDIHRHLKSYFTNDGFLRGLVLSKPNVILHWNYTRQLQFYGFDLKPADTTTKVPSTAQITPMEPNHSSTFYALPTTDATTFMSTHQSSKTDITTVTENIKLETEEPSLTTTTSTVTNIVTTATKESKTTLTNPSTIKFGTTENTQSTTSSHPITSTLLLESTTETTLKEVETTVITTQLSSNPATTPSSTEPTTIPSTTEPTTIPSTTEPTTIPSTTEPITIPSTTEPITIPSTTESTQTTSSPLTEPMTTNILSESTKPETTMLLTTSTNPQTEGRENEYEVPGITTWTKESTVTFSNQNIEMSFESTTQPMAPQTLTPNPPEETSIPQPESTNTENVTVPMFETSDSITLSPDPATIPPTTRPIIATFSEKIIQENTPQGTTISDITSEQTFLPETSASIEETDTSSASNEKTDMSLASLQETDTTTINTVATTTSTETTTNELTTQQATMSRSKELASDKETLRKKRALYYTGNVPEHREGISNWVPHYQDPRWNYHAPLENWFFSYFGGIKVPIITYSAYLPFAYLTDFSTLALQVPLDDPRYYMLILLPEDKNGLEKLLYSLQWCPLREILDQLKTTAVYATVPVFTIVKHLNLVPALAKLGILSIFDPSTADLSAMSSEKALFVRTIEQVVTVSLRKYFANYRWFEAKPGEVEQHFIANHPFAYFVLDKETQVALMTGTIVNPSAYNQ